MNARGFFNTANLLSLSRIPLGLLVYFTLFSDTPGARLLALGIFIVAGVTDFLDGLAARRQKRLTGQTNRFGIMLDPIADKIFAAIVALALIQLGRFPVWLAIVVVGRDILIVLAGAVLLRGRKVISQSNLPGKYYFGTLSLLLASYIVDFNRGVALLIPITLILWLWSFIGYGLSVRQSWLSKGVSENASERASESASENTSEKKVPESSPPGWQRPLRLTVAITVCAIYVAMLILDNPLGL